MNSGAYTIHSYIVENTRSILTKLSSTTNKETYKTTTFAAQSIGELESYAQSLGTAFNMTIQQLNTAVTNYNNLANVILNIEISVYVITFSL